MKTSINKLILATVLAPVFVTCLSYAAPLDLCSEFTHNCSIQKQAIQGPDVPQDQYVLDVTVGQITEAQFQSLHSKFHTSPSIPYDSQRAYKLVDFLPIFIQKTNGRVLVPHALPVAPELLKELKNQNKSTEKVSYVDGNCHSVSWQWVNHLQGQGSTDALLTLADGERLTLGFKVDPKELQPGDVLVVNGNGGFDQDGAVLHSAIYLGYGLVFEKGNPGKEYPYRMSFLKDVMSKYKKVDTNAAFDFYRIHANSPVLTSLITELSLATPGAQSSFGLQLQNLPASLLEQYILQENWDNSQGMSVFTLGRILKASQASPQNWYSILKK
ncbi:hypothetical protein [Bdellovibrio sp. HCB337]|uniref:hypothetical protein n=1 Tax=Bdellovibrio sp. HCB337 TaxID=3394358 RepID=UPI0039A5F78B